MPIRALGDTRTPSFRYAQVTYETHWPVKCHCRRGPTYTPFNGGSGQNGNVLQKYHSCNPCLESFLLTTHPKTFVVTLPYSQGTSEKHWPVKCHSRRGPHLMVAVVMLSDEQAEQADEQLSDVQLVMSQVISWWAATSVMRKLSHLFVMVLWSCKLKYPFLTVHRLYCAQVQQNLLVYYL